MGTGITAGARPAGLVLLAQKGKEDTMAQSASVQKRVTRLLVWLAVWAGTGGLCGLTVTSLYVQISPDLFYVGMMGLWNQEHPRLLVALWGLQAGGGIGLILGACVGLTRRGPLWGARPSLAVLVGAVRCLAATSLASGLAAALLAMVVPGSYARLAPLPLADGTWVYTRWAFVEGSLWGWMLGAPLYLAATLWELRNRARALAGDE